jgi:hypothetical protein
VLLACLGKAGNQFELFARHVTPVKMRRGR